jgi:hypothetical protein
VIRQIFLSPKPGLLLAKSVRGEKRVCGGAPWDSSWSQSVCFCKERGYHFYSTNIFSWLPEEAFSWHMLGPLVRYANDFPGLAIFLAGSSCLASG